MSSKVSQVFRHELSYLFLYSKELLVISLYSAVNVMFSNGLVL